METIKGFKDYTGEEAVKRKQMKDVLTRYFTLYGFEPAESPIIEYETFVKGDNADDDAISEIFKLKDRGKRKLALRYEFTFQLSRLARNKKLPYKRYQLGYVFRDEPTSTNRFRQFTQCDADIVGSSIKDEAEILSLASNILNEFGLKTVININNRKLLNEILDSEGIKKKEEVIREIDKLDKLSELEIKKNLKKYNAEKMLDLFKKPESYFKKYDSYSEIIKLKGYCKMYGVKVNFQPFLARGLSYYNGSIFEIKSKKMKETLIAGGSYIVNNFQSTGISFGLERLSNLSDYKKDNSSILVVSLSQDSESIDLISDFRNNGIISSLYYGKPSKALQYADSKSIDYVLFVGEKEIKNKKYTLKDMKTGKEVSASISSILKKLI
ncbi:histidine--tRNA ligase [archaeon]|jgi:histidyl-tRNA synthetase|nr:histidine--tRNA ligase [archaeon]